MGTITVAGLDTGQTNLNLTAGTTTATVPVTVLEPLNMFPAFQTTAKYGVAMTALDDGGYRFDGTATQAVSLSAWIRPLQAGTYRLDGPPDSNPVWVRVKDSIDTFLVRGTGRFTLDTAQDVQVDLVISAHTYDGLTIHPTLYRTVPTAADEPETEEPSA